MREKMGNRIFVGGLPWAVGDGELRAHFEGCGEITDAVEVPQRAFACMLGGDQGTTLFVITAPSDPQAGLRPGQGAIWAVEVDSQHAGLP